MMGVGGLILVAKTKAQLFHCAALAVQGGLIQCLVLYHLWHHLAPFDPEVQEPRTVDRYLVVGAVYLHLINSFKDMPYCATALLCFADIHESLGDRLLALPIFFIDSFVIPVVTAVLGSFYICTSLTGHDVILNSCGLVFINDIDNFIIHINSHFMFLQGLQKQGTVHLPRQTGMMIQAVTWTFSYLPFVPFFLALGITTYALDNCGY